MQYSPLAVERKVLGFGVKDCQFVTQEARSERTPAFLGYFQLHSRHCRIYGLVCGLLKHLSPKLGVLTSDLSRFRPVHSMGSYSVWHPIISFRGLILRFGFNIRHPISKIFQHFGFAVQKRVRSKKETRSECTACSWLSLRCYISFTIISGFGLDLRPLGRVCHPILGLSFRAFRVQDLAFNVVLQDLPPGSSPLGFRHAGSKV